MTRTEVLADLAVAEAELRDVLEESERTAHAIGFLDKFQAMDFAARAQAARQRIFNLRGELQKVSPKK